MRSQSSLSGISKDFAPDLISHQRGSIGNSEDSGAEFNLDPKPKGANLKSSLVKKEKNRQYFKGYALGFGAAALAGASDAHASSTEIIHHGAGTLENIKEEKYMKKSV